jgi:hypothetical protein
MLKKSTVEVYHGTSTQYQPSAKSTRTRLSGVRQTDTLLSARCRQPLGGVLPLAKRNRPVRIGKAADGNRSMDIRIAVSCKAPFRQAGLCFSENLRTRGGEARVPRWGSGYASEVRIIAAFDCWIVNPAERSSAHHNSARPLYGEPVRIPHPLRLRR